MHEFTHRSPTEIIFGKDAEMQIVQMIRKHKGHRVLLVYGGGSVVRSGLLKTITDQLDEAKIEYQTYGGIQPNPLVSSVRKGVSIALAMNADMIVAVGGGSAIDAAKAIAHGTASPETDIWDFWTQKVPLVKTLPVGSVLTIPAAGSETSSSCVITEDETKTKLGYNIDVNYPAFTLMNPKFAQTLPQYQIGCGISDIMMHTLDRYFNYYEDNETTDEVAEAIMRMTIKNGKKAWEDASDYHAMSELMWCGSLSHNGLTGLGGTRDFSVHMFGHELSGKFNLAHGASMAVSWTPVSLYLMDAKPQRYARYARNVWGLPDEGTDEEQALRGILKTRDFFKSLGMPVCAMDFLDRELTQDEIDDLALRCCNYHKKTVGKMKVLDYEDMRIIFGNMNKRIS